MLLGLVGVGLFIGDAVITPAISVLSAVEGLQVITPELAPFVLPITLTVLVILFGAQHYGTAGIGRLFGPIMLLWFGVLAALGAYEIAQNPAILQAVNPLYALDFMISRPGIAFITLGPSCSASPVRRRSTPTWATLAVAPSSLPGAPGDARPAAQLLRPGSPAAAQSRRHRESLLPALAPPGWPFPADPRHPGHRHRLPGGDPGTYSVVRQAILLGYLPRQEIRHTSEHEIGQIYLPLVNWLLLGASSSSSSGSRVQATWPPPTASR